MGTHSVQSAMRVKTQLGIGWRAPARQQQQQQQQQQLQQPQEQQQQREPQEQQQQQVAAKALRKANCTTNASQMAISCRIGQRVDDPPFPLSPYTHPPLLPPLLTSAYPCCTPPPFRFTTIA